MKSLIGSLVWIDLEMSGLNIETDVILEIATVITDDNLNVIATGPSLVIHQSDNILNNMDTWCTQSHQESGLSNEVKKSIISTQEAENRTIDFIREYCSPNTAILCGNSVWQDRLFLRKYMPRIIDYLHYRLIDVSSIKELISRWYRYDKKKTFIKAESHRALTDIIESIEELKYYKDYFFKENTFPQ